MKNKRRINKFISVMMMMSIILSMIPISKSVQAEVIEGNIIDENIVEKNIDETTNSFVGFFGGSRVYKYNDENKDGVTDEGDLSVEGFEFILDFYDENGNIIRTEEAVTNSEGYFIVEEVNGVYEFIQQNVSPSYPFPISGNVNPIRIYPKDNQGFKNIKIEENNKLPGKPNQKRFQFVDENSDGNYDYIEYRHTAIYHNIMTSISKAQVAVNANDDYILQPKNIEYEKNKEAAFEVTIDKVSEGVNRITASIYKSGVVGVGEAITSVADMNSDLTTPDGFVIFLRTHRKEYNDKSGNSITESSSLMIRDLILNGVDINGSDAVDIFLEDGKPHQFLITNNNPYPSGQDSLVLTGKYKMDWNKFNNTTNEDITSTFKLDGKKIVFYIKGVPYHSVNILGEREIVEPSIKKGSVELTKLDEDNNKLPLGGAEFKLLNSNKEVIKENLVTNENGKIIVEELEAGIYYFVETKAPIGYELSDKEYMFEIKEDKEHIQVEATNKKIKTEIVSNVKVNIEATKILEGKELSDGMFSFQLLNEEDEVIETVTNDLEGNIKFTPITYSEIGSYKYKIKEINNEIQNVIYDESIFEVTVNIAKNKESKLIAEIIYENGEEVIFNNKYIVREMLPETGDEGAIFYPSIIILIGVLLLVSDTITRRIKKFNSK